MKQRQQTKAPENNKKISNCFIENQHAQTFTNTGTSVPWK